MDEKKREEIIDAAGDWIRAARRDIEAYRSLVRCRFFPLVKCRPKEPHMAINHLQQAVEKMVKAMAIASGKFEYNNFMKYKHDSLSLYADLIEKMLKPELVKDLADSIQGKVKTNSKVEIISYDEAYHRLEEVKAKIRRRGERIPDWYLEFALLPEKEMKSVLNVGIKSYNRIRNVRMVLRLLPDRLFTVDRKDAEKSMKTASTFLSKRGILLYERMEKFLDKDEIKNFISEVNREGKLNPIKMLREGIMPGFVFGELLVLSAFTFTHGVSPRYPGDRLADNDSGDIFNDRLYDSNLGVVRCVMKLGKLTELVLKEMKNVIPYTADWFKFLEKLELSRLNKEER